MKNFRKIIFLMVITLGLFGLVYNVMAYDLSDDIGFSVGLFTDVDTPIGTIIKGALALVGTIFLVLTVYAGILWMTAAGNESKTDSAKNILIAAVIGLAIVMTAYTITMFVTGQMGGSTGPANTSSNTSAPAASGSCFDPGNGGRPVSGFSTEEACHNGGYDWVVPN